MNEKELDIEVLCQQLVDGNLLALAQALSIVESDHEAHVVQSQALLKATSNAPRKAITIGITGIPGVGKSTFIDALGSHILSNKKRLAVLAVDPSSEKSQGSILGDKTRMQTIAADPNAFIRPSPSGGHLGGVTKNLPASIQLLDHAGYDVVLIETVGVGQSEIDIARICDAVLFLTIAGAGDELQGIKRGILEWVELVIINKADGENLSQAEQTRRQYEQIIPLHAERQDGWNVPTVITSALTQKGITEVWEYTLQYIDQQLTNGHLQKKRQQQYRHWLHQLIQQRLLSQFYGNPKIQQKVSELENEIQSGSLHPAIGAQQLLELYRSE